MRFSIRDLLLVTVIVALSLGWGLDRQWEFTKGDAEKSEQKNNLLEGYIYEIDRQLADHGLQLEQKFNWGLGGMMKGHFEVVPLDMVERERRDKLPDPRKE